LTGLATSEFTGDRREPPVALYSARDLSNIRVAERSMSDLAGP
jgi:hypothetical protein